MIPWPGPPKRGESFWCPVPCGTLRGTRRSAEQLAKTMNIGPMFQNVLSLMSSYVSKKDIKDIKEERSL